MAPDAAVARTDFTTAQRAALDMMAQRRDVKLTAGDADRVTATMRALLLSADTVHALKPRREPCELVARSLFRSRT